MQQNNSTDTTTKHAVESVYWGN